MHLSKIIHNGIRWSSDEGLSAMAIYGVISASRALWSLKQVVEWNCNGQADSWVVNILTLDSASFCIGLSKLSSNYSIIESIFDLNLQIKANYNINMLD